MEMELFNILEEYKKLETNLYFRLIDDEKMEIEKAEELVEGFTDFYERTLKLGKYLDEEAYVNKDTYLIKRYKGLDSYLKLNIIYEYDNNLVLCETTSSMILLVPKEYIEAYQN
ncbi:hypothetical protein [Siminovitchia sp. 179-K 8D1 HS]|uniref:hypothetical protein n=1 Tax=Siminovitchia sp. 179-K 8D1 HS TaxID=3142385 RepID=UPI00399FF155